MHDTLVPIDDQIQQVLALHMKRKELELGGIFTETLQYGRRKAQKCEDIVFLGARDHNQHSITFWLQRFETKQDGVVKVAGHVIRSSTPLMSPSGQTLVTRYPLGDEPWDSEHARTVVPVGLDDVLATFAV